MTGAAAARPGCVRLERDGSIGWLILDNPARHNALTAAMWAAIPDRLAEAVADDLIRVIVLRGAGARAFSAGADISEFDAVRQGSSGRAYEALNHAAFDALRQAAKPAIAMIEGFCLGGGLALALCCDLRLAGEGAQFAIPPAKLGIGYHPHWLEPLLACVSPASAKELIFTGDRYDAQAALRMGLVNRVFPSEALEPAVLTLAGTIAGNAPLTIRAAKRSIDAYGPTLSAEALGEIMSLIDGCFASEDYAEGRRAFQEKRPPAFKGR